MVSRFDIKIKGIGALQCFYPFLNFMGFLVFFSTILAQWQLRLTPTNLQV